MIDVIITKFLPFAVLEWRNVLRIKIIFYVKDKVQKSLAEALNRFEKQEAIASWIHSYFDNVMTKFVINNRTDALETEQQGMTIVHHRILVETVSEAFDFPVNISHP